VSQLDYLQKNYTFITIEELIGSIENKESLPENPVLLTFNDNYIDHFEYVFPELDKRGIQGCFFPEVSAIKEQKLVLNHKIHFILAAAEKPVQVVKEIYHQLDNYRKEYALDENDLLFESLAVESKYDSKEIVFIKKLLQDELPYTLTQSVTSSLFNKFVGINEDVFARELYMDETQIRCMVRNGMYFGILGYDHKRLNLLTREEQHDELSKAKHFVLNLGLNKEEITVTYPWGVYNKDTLDILQSIGCKAAFTSEAAIADLDKYHPYELPRFDTNDIPKSNLN